MLSFYVLLVFYGFQTHERMVIVYKINLKIVHTLGAGEALKRIKGLLEGLKIQFAGQFTDLRENWNGNNGTFTAKIMGMDASGSLQVADSNVIINMNLPSDIAIFAGFIKIMVESKTKDVLK